MKKFERIMQIGQAGAYTSFVTKKSALRKLIVGGNITNCQDKINEEIQNSDKRWLQLTHILQNIQGKGISTMIGKIQTESVVVKAQTEDAAKKEYETQERLRQVPGFIKYHCHFTCAGDKGYIEQFATANEQTRICQASGDSMGVILMPYYSSGSVESAMQKLSKAEFLTLLECIVVNYANAYNKLEFTHGDFFSKNIVINDTGHPVIIDFEKSQFNSKHKCDIFWNDLDNMCLDLSHHPIVGNKLFNIARVLTLHRAYQTEPSEQIINDLVTVIRLL